jgi:5-hydroxyisourate hydrolase
MSTVLKDSNISTHVLDTAKGIPAGNLQLELFHCTNTLECSSSSSFDYSWGSFGVHSTDNDGRARFVFDLQPGIYKMTFYTQNYFERDGSAHFYPKVDIIFRLSDVYRHHHIPLILSPYGYSTYRGS